ERREAPRQVKAWPRQAASKLAYLPPFACLLWHAVSPREERCQSSVGRQQGSAKNSSQLIGQSWHVEKTCRQIIGTNHLGIGTNPLQLGTKLFDDRSLGSASSSLSACRRFCCSLDRAREELT